MTLVYCGHALPITGPTKDNAGMPGTTKSDTWTQFFSRHSQRHSHELRLEKSKLLLTLALLLAILCVAHLLGNESVDTNADLAIPLFLRALTHVSSTKNASGVPSGDKYN